MKRTLDKIDERIIEELSHNSRSAHNDIAVKVNLSRNAVRLRIVRLERDGHIKGYTIVKGLASSEYPLIRAMLFVYRQDRMRGSEVVRSVSAMPEVVACNIMSGDPDIVLTVEVASPDRISEIWSDISCMPGVVNAVTSFVLSSAK
ncbi:Leucine-responsive regulatory protein [compost metagenome]